MADFCKQCSIENFGQDFGDLKDLVTEDAVKDGFFAAVICEGCGFVIVDHQGVCRDKNCEKHGTENKQEENSQVG